MIRVLFRIFLAAACWTYLSRGPLGRGAGGESEGLRLLKLNFPWLGVVGLVLGVVFPAGGSLLGGRTEVTDGEIVAPETLTRPGLPGLTLSGVAVGETRPWTVLETRAETVTRLRSGGGAELCAPADVTELSDEREPVAESGGLPPLADTAGWVLIELAPLTATAGDVAADGEQGWDGGRGARYLTLAGCD